MRRIALINQKGGVGKTTTAVNLGAALAREGREVVLMDLDPQANLSLHLGLELADGEPSTYSLLIDRHSMGEALRPTAVEGLSVVPSHIDLSGAELELASAMGRETLLREVLAAWVEDHQAAHGRPPCDYLLLDCPPSLGLLAINGLAAVEEVFLAVQTEFFALQGMSRLVDVVKLVQRRMNPDLAITGIVPCLYDARLRLAREVLGEIRKYFPGHVFHQAIRSNVKLAEAPSFGQSIFEYAPESVGARDYAALGLEVIAQEPAGTYPARVRTAAEEPAPAPAARENAAASQGGVSPSEEVTTAEVAPGAGEGSTAEGPRDPVQGPSLPPPPNVITVRPQPPAGRRVVRAKELPELPTDVFTVPPADPEA